MLKMAEGFIERDGPLVIKLFCKVCGEQIAQIKKNEETGGERLGRWGNFREVKIEHWLEFDHTQPDYHITHMCSKCAGGSLDAETLNEIYKADLADMARAPGVEIPEVWKSRQPRRVVPV